MSTKSPKIDVCVVGGGAAGMMAAITAAEAGAEVMVLERKDRPLRKLMITGKGRCNLTNDCTPEQVMQNIVHNGKFLFSALHAFPPSAVMEYFTDLGVPLKTERGSRVFPVSDRAADVADALMREGKRLGVRIIHGRAEEILVHEDMRIRGVKWESGAAEMSALILATGGLSYPLTGSTGDGYRLSEALGHRIIPCRPSLVPLISPDRDCAEMQGLSLRNVRVTLMEDARAVWQDQGEMQFTHFGVTGPLVLSASAHMTGSGIYSLELDLKPALDEEALDRRLLRDFGEKLNRDFHNALGDLLPRLMIPVIVRRSGIDPGTKIHTVTKEQRKALLMAIKHFAIPITGTRPVEEAVVTAGGIDTREVRPGDLSSKLVNGLYFAGEILDLDAYTGGFNLQVAWCTGRTAGRAAAAYGKGSNEH